MGLINECTNVFKQLISSVDWVDFSNNSFWTSMTKRARDADAFIFGGLCFEYLKRSDDNN